MKSPTIVLEIPVFQNIQDKDLRFLPLSCLIVLLDLPSLKGYRWPHNLGWGEKDFTPVDEPWVSTETMAEDKAHVHFLPT